MEQVIKSVSRIMNILNDINTILCPIKSNNNTIELTAHTSCYWGLRLTLCYKPRQSKPLSSYTFYPYTYIITDDFLAVPV